MNIPDKGKAWVFGDNINTDYIISSKRKRDTLEPTHLAKFMMEDIRPGFGHVVKPGDFVVAGKNFGCGSAMEIATSVIKGAQVRAIIAQSFSRTFFRNCINGGLLLIETDTGSIKEGDLLQIENAGNSVTLCNLTRNTKYHGSENTPYLNEIVQAGGLISYLKANQGFT